MTNRPLYVRKFHSGRLKEFGYSIENTFDESKDLKEIIGLSDSQMLRTIRDINKRVIDKNKLEILLKMKDKYKYISIKQNTNNKYAQTICKKLNETFIDNPLVQRLKEKYLNKTFNSDELKRLQNKINRTMFIEDYVVVVMDSIKQYEYLYKNGFYINGKCYKRLSCSSGQARVSTVIFCNDQIIDEVKNRLNNGRNENIEFSPSKFNAYFGLYGSATKVVSEPKFIVIKDFENTDTFIANYVIENGWKVDDTIIQKEIKNMPINRTDGMGLISYNQAEKWAKEIGLDYVPSQFCIRQSFMKGMLCVFPIHEFCEEVNNGNYIIDTIYKDGNGEYIKADLRNYDIIITESQFKIWDSYSSIDDYINNCRKNKLYWGIALHTPKEAKHMMKLNYQFIQTLNLSQKDIEELSSQFVDWIMGVSYDDIYYMLLFLMGINNDKDKISKFLSSSDNYWIKSLIINKNIKDDKYIRTKIRDLIRHKIENACMGDIYVDGNFQVIVSDPYGFMQHACGLDVTGLLKKGEFYSNYWNEKNIKQIDGMRSPLTYFSEHVILDLRNDKDTNKWYKYCKLGIILNYHGHESINFAGSDYDFDILASVSHNKIIGGIYKDELPVIYDVPKPKKFVFTDDDLYRADTFSFGSIIGSITNKSSNGYALLPVIEEKYGKDSQEYILVKSRLKQCCKAQSAQIDKAKIGRAVKGIPNVWVNYIRLPKNEKKLSKCRRLKRKQLYNNTLLDKYPYFFKYVYKDTKRQYKKYLEEYNITCKQKYKTTFEELENLRRKTKEQKEFIENFYTRSPIIHSSSSMNLLCKYIESINFNISQHTKIETNKDVYKLYKNTSVDYLEWYIEIIKSLKKYMSNKAFENIIVYTDEKDEDNYKDNIIQEFKVDADSLYETINKICSNNDIVVNCLVDYFYKEKPSSNKDLLWASYGKFIYKNIKRNTNNDIILFPFPSNLDEKIDLKYLGYNYTLKEVNL
jgi:hypothetical protein